MKQRGMDTRRSRTERCRITKSSRTMVQWKRTAPPVSSRGGGGQGADRLRSRIFVSFVMDGRQPTDVTALTKNNRANQSEHSLQQQQAKHGCCCCVQRTGGSANFETCVFPESAKTGGSANHRCCLSFSFSHEIRNTSK